MKDSMAVVSKLHTHNQYVRVGISYLRNISIYKLLVHTSSLMCLACYVAERVGFMFRYCRAIYVLMKLCVSIYPKVIGGLSIIGNIPGIFLKKHGKIMEISWNFVSPEKWEP